MDRYQSIKVVWAVVIVEILEGGNLLKGEDGESYLCPSQNTKDGGGYQPEIGDWLIKYDNDYMSVSPKKAFEDGYRIFPENWKERMLIEAADLQDKVASRMIFVDKPEFKELTEQKQRLMKSQLQAMQLYEKALKTRIDLEFNPLTGEELNPEPEETKAEEKEIESE